MTKELKVKHWALTAALGLLLGACAHQEGTQTSGELGMEGAPSEETASIERSLGDGNSEGGAASSELAPIEVRPTDTHESIWTPRPSSARMERAAYYWVSRVIL